MNSVNRSRTADRSMHHRFRTLGIALMALFALLYANLFRLQVLQGPQLANHPGNTRNAVRDFGQLRGSIITADGVVVAESIRNPDRTSKFRYLRRYPHNQKYAHIAGYVSFTYGATGVERKYNGVLAGREGALVLSRDKLEQLLQDRTEVSDVTLTLHDTVQRSAIAGLGDRRGAVVALDIRTGAILAMYSYPSFDPGSLSGTDQDAVIAAWKALEADATKPTLPRAWRQLYPPGSTFKTVTTAAALESGNVTPESIFPMLRELQLPLTTRPLRNFAGKECGGTLVASFAASCNTTFAQLGLDLGPEQLGDQARKFGFNRQPPLDVSPGPVASRFPSVDFYDKNTPALAQSAIGQSDVAATPLQMALVAAGIANGGRVPTPFVVSRVQERSGAEVSSPSPGAWTTAVDPTIALELRDMMVAAVDDGTGGRAQLDGISVAAKTGTAQTTAGETPAAGSRPRAHAWTIGFAPADAPRVAVAVIIENQEEVDATTGGRIAAPVLREVLRTSLVAVPE
jgi:penicillin-binding protein A